MLTLSQSSKHTGKSKSVISRAVDNGKLPAIRNDDGTYAIDPADLYSLWPKLPPEQPEQNTGTSTGTATSTSAVPPQNTAEQAERAALEALAASQAGQVDDLRATIADLQKRLDDSEADRRQAGENSNRQIDQLTQLVAMEKKEKQTLQLEHQTDDSTVAELQKKLDAAEQARHADQIRIKQLSHRLKQAEPEKGWFGKLFA